MKITDFKEGDLICRTRVPKKYVADPDYIGTCFMFSEIVQNTISLMILLYPSNQKFNGEICEFELEDYNDDLWDFYKSPKLRRPKIINGLNDRRLKAESIGDKLSMELYDLILNRFMNGDIKKD